MRQLAKPKLVRATAYPLLRYTTWDPGRRELTYEYFIYPPEDRQFFPPDDALKELIEMFPGLEFKESVRFKNRDYFSVVGYKHNPLTVRTDNPARRKMFLREVTDLALRTRPMAASYERACDEFMATHQFKKIEWDSMYIDATDYDNKISRGRRMKFDSRFHAFERLRILSRGKLPFVYKAAQR